MKINEKQKKTKRKITNEKFTMVNIWFEVSLFSNFL